MLYKRNLKEYDTALMFGENISSPRVTTKFLTINKFDRSTRYSVFLSVVFNGSGGGLGGYFTPGKTP